MIIKNLDFNKIQQLEKEYEDKILMINFQS